MKRFLLFTLVVMGLTSHAQTIQNVDFGQKDKKITITWQMLGLKVADVADIKIYYRIGTNTYREIPPSSIRGHYGKVTVSDVPASGILNAKATWDVLSSMDKLQGELDFKIVVTIEKPFSNTFTDKRDGERYKVVQIGNQIWMAENLRFTSGKYITNVSEWDNLSDNNIDAAYCYYDNNELNKQKYGALYTYAAALNACPNGWHLPTDDEWQQLEDYLVGNGYNYDNTIVEDKIAKALASKIGWREGGDIGDVGYNPESNNKSGFTGMPGACRTDYGSFCRSGDNGDWWSATESSATNAYLRRLYRSNEHLFRSDTKKSFGLSVRCVRD